MSGSSTIKIKNEMAVCSPQAAANYFLKKAQSDRKMLTPMQLIKLVYIAHGWTLALLSRRLFDEKIEAWQHGPVIPSLYHEFKMYGDGFVSKPSLNMDIDGNVYYPRVNSTEQEALTVLDKVWEVYKGLSASQLRALTHRAGTPWSNCYKDGERHIEIKQEEIRKHYIELIENLANSEKI